MAVNPFQILASQTLPAVANLLSYTVPATGVQRVVIKEIHVCNTDSSVFLFYMKTTPSGGAAVFDYDGEPVQPAGQGPLTISRAKVLMPGDKVEFYADTAAKLTIDVSGLKWT